MAKDYLVTFHIELEVRVENMGNERESRDVAIDWFNEQGVGSILEEALDDTSFYYRGVYSLTSIDDTPDDDDHRSDLQRILDDIETGYSTSEALKRNKPK